MVIKVLNIVICLITCISLATLLVYVWSIYVYFKAKVEKQETANEVNYDRFPW